MSTTQPNGPGGAADAPIPTTPAMRPEEIQAREARAAAALPPRDRQSVERSAGEGMVGTPVEAATIPTRHIAGPARLESAAGEFLLAVEVDLQIIPPTWSGAMTATERADDLAVPGAYRLRLPDGRRLAMTVTGRAGDTFTVEGDGDFAEQ